MSVINTNISALQAQNSLRSTNLNLSTAMERLSTGTRINSAKDDAAGLAISTRMTASIRGISAAIRNANDGISLTQTAEGSLSQISDNLQRVRELAVQSSNTGNNASDRAAMNNEAKQLIAEIDRVASNTGFNGIKLLDGSFQNQALQVGAGNDANDRIAVSIGSAKSSALGVGSGSSYAASTAGTNVGATALAAGVLSINNNFVGAAQADGVSNTASSTSGIAVAAAINAISAKTNVTATVGATSGYAGTTVTGFTTAIAAGDVKINGVSIGAIDANTTAAGRGGQVAAAVNAVSSQTGVTATFDKTSGAVSLAAADGRNITVDAVSAGGSSKVTGLGSGTVLTATSATAATTTTAMAANAFSVNGVNVGAVAAGTAVTGVTETAAITVGAGGMTAGQTLTIGGLTYTSTGVSTQTEVGAAFASLAAGAITGGGTAKGTYSGALTGFSTSAAVANVITATSATANTSVTDLAAASGTGASAITTITTATQGVTAVSAVESKAANVATAINLVTSQTGVTASSTAGKVTLVSDGRAITSTAVTADTGIDVAVAVTTAATTANTLTNRSSVTLSSTQQAGINVSGGAAAMAAAGLTEANATVTTTAGAGVSSIDLSTAAGSQAALTTLDSAINTITDSRAAMGAYQNRLTASISNLESTSSNLSASRSRILDTDYAKETTNLAKAQIISQAATAMLAQANQSGQSVLALLK